MTRQISEIFNLEQFNKEDMKGKIKYFNAVTDLVITNTITEEEAKICDEFLGRELGIEHPTLTRCSLILATRMLYSKTGNYEYSEEYAIELLANILMEEDENMDDEDACLESKMKLLVDCFNECNLKYKLGLE